MRAPEAISKEGLLLILRDIIAHIEADDSFEGNISWEMPWSEEIGDPVTDGPEVDFRVGAGYRIGNSMGQGGMRMVGDFS